MVKGFTKHFSVDSYVFFPVESISAIYIFVLCIINEIISIFDTWAEITGKTSYKRIIKRITTLFSVDSWVFYPVESISAIYIFVLCIINQIISILVTWAENNRETPIQFGKRVYETLLSWFLCTFFCRIHFCNIHFCVVHN